MRFFNIASSSVLGRSLSKNEPFPSETTPKLIDRIKALFIHVISDKSDGDLNRYIETKTKSTLSGYGRAKKEKVKFKNWRFLLLNYLGFPNKNLHDECDDSKLTSRDFLINLLKNMIGWRKSTPTLGLILTAIVVTPINILALPFNFLINNVKLITEFVPGLFAIVTDEMARRSSEMAPSFFDDDDFEEASSGRGFFKTASSYFSKALFAIASGLHFVTLAAYAIGCSITSPYDLMKSVDELPEDKFPKLARWLLKALILLTSATAYAVIAPYAAKFVIKPLLSLASQHLPPVLISAADFLTKHLKPIFEGLGQAPIYLFQEIGKFFGLSNFGLLTSLPAATGIGFFVGIIAAPVAKLAEEVSKFWEKQMLIKSSKGIVKSGGNDKSAADTIPPLSPSIQKLMASDRTDEIEDDNTVSAPSTVHHSPKPTRSCCGFLSDLRVFSIFQPSSQSNNNNQVPTASI